MGTMLEALVSLVTPESLRPENEWSGGLRFEPQDFVDKVTLKIILRTFIAESPSTKRFIKAEAS